MQIRMLTSLQSASRDYSEGRELDVPEAVARRLIARGYAQEVAPSFSRYVAPERAVAQEPERAVKRKYTRRGKKNVGQA